MPPPVVDDRAASKAIAFLKTHQNVKQQRIDASVDADDTQPTLADDLATIELWASCS